MFAYAGKWSYPLFLNGHNISMERGFTGASVPETSAFTEKREAPRRLLSAC